MRLVLRQCAAVTALVFTAFSFALLGRPNDAAANERYLVVLPGETCSINVGDVGVKSFRMLIPADRLKAVANNTTVVRVHVCECLLAGGDMQKCALD